MILFLTNIAMGNRGGEETNKRIHDFVKNNFIDVIPSELTNVPSNLRSPLKHAFYNLITIRKYKPDLLVIDVSSGLRNLLAVLWAMIFHKKLMTIYLGKRMEFRYDNIIVKGLVRFAEALYLKKSDLIYTNSDYSANSIREESKTKAKIVIINDGITVNAPDNVKRINNSLIELLFVGACTKVKGLKYLIESLIYLKDLDIILNIAGEYNKSDVYYKNILDFIANNNLSEKINFLGFVEPEILMRLYSKSSIFVLPSLSEGYGKVLAEALSFGLPIVATNVGAIPEMVDDKINAILVEPENSKEIANAIKQIVSDSRLRESMKTANIAKAKNLQTWETYNDDLINKLLPALIETTGIKPANWSS